MEDLTEILSEAKRLVEDAKAVAKNDNIRPAVMRQAGSLGRGPDGTLVSLVDAVKFEPLFEQEMRKYDVYAQRLESLSYHQQQLLEQITVSFLIHLVTYRISHCHHQITNTEFVQVRKSDTRLKERERALQNLDSAYYKYRELSVNLNEGLKFYEGFNKILNQFRDHCRDVSSLFHFPYRFCQLICFQVGPKETGDATKYRKFIFVAKTIKSSG